MSGRADGPADDGPSDDEVDRRFAELMAGLEQEGGATARRTAPQPSASERETVDDAAARSDDPAEPPSPVTAGPRDYTLAVDELDESFVPEPPPSLDGVDRVSMLGWIGAVGGPIAFIVLLLVWQGAPALVWLTALAATLAGWALVVWRLPRSRPDDDDGAVV